MVDPDDPVVRARDARDDAIKAEIEQRVAEMIARPTEMVDWLFEQGSGLWDIDVQTPGGSWMGAEEAMIRFAPPWLIQQIRHALINDPDLRREVTAWIDTPVEVCP